MPKTAMPDIATLRAQIDCLGPRGPGRRFPAALRTDVMAWAKRERAAGASGAQLSAELGLPWQTILRWMEGKSGSIFKMVELGEVEASAPGLTVHGPCGLRIEVRDVDALAALLRRLT